MNESQAKVREIIAAPPPALGLEYHHSRLHKDRRQAPCFHGTLRRTITIING